MKRVILFFLGSLPVLAFGQSVLLYNDGAILKIQSGATLFVEGGVTNTNSGQIDNDGTLEIQGNYLQNNSATWEPSQPNTLKFSGSTTSDVTPGTAVFQTVIDNKNGANINLLGAMTTNTNFDFNATGTSKVTLNGNNFILGNSATITGYESDEYVATNGAGMMQKNVSANATFEFPVGDATFYSPITTKFTGTAYSGTANISTKVNNVVHPNKPTDATDYLTRYWDVNQTGITTYSDSLTGTFVSADDMIGTTSKVKGSVYDGANWGYVGANNGTNTVKGVTSVSVADFTGINFFGSANIKVFLAGAMPANNTPPMTTLLSTPTQLIPLNSPYSIAPWNAPAATATSIPANTTDWILVESRDANNVIVSQTSAFLKNDGTIVGIDGGTLKLKDALPNSIVSIRHRNHLGIRTPNTIALDQLVPINWDFSTGTGQAYTNNAITTNANMRLMGSTYCMWGGNANLTGSGLTKISYLLINNDPQAILNAMGGNNQNNLLEVYHNADLNLNRKVSYLLIGNDPAVVLSNLGGNNQNTTNQHL